jgi:hypothetical protein
MVAHESKILERLRSTFEARQSKLPLGMVMVGDVNACHDVDLCTFQNRDKCKIAYSRYCPRTLIYTTLRFLSMTTEVHEKSLHCTR